MYCFCEPGIWIRCVLVSFWTVGVGLDLNPWDLFRIGLWGPRVAIVLISGIFILDWFGIGSWQECALKPSSKSPFARCQIRL